MDAKLEAKIIDALQAVKDPEIPSISIQELGMIYELVIDGCRVKVKVLPTFAGCPALDIIERDIKKVILQLVEITECQVEYVFDVPWTTDRISELGRQRMKEYGIAPPPLQPKEGEPWQINCPYCDSTYTTMENLFGPTACRCILYCKSCKNVFEAIKPVMKEY